MTPPAAGRARRRAKAGPTPIADEVYDELLSRVLSARLGPGARVTIDALGRELEVSQTPIREALHRLEQDGLVVRHHLAGYRVVPRMTREQFENLVELRLLLEPVAAGHAAERPRAEDAAGLAALAERMGGVGHALDMRAYADFSLRDAEFHDAVARAGGNHLVQESLARLHTHIHLFRLANDELITTRAVGEHAAIVEAVRAGDPAAAAAAMHRHIEASADRFRAAFD
ncbi:GntR family transcriptional regulator [Georgenia deserti]|uniref:GntR family transcriptional regulator n=1 Tax=Georgenia deserti TaxID=2093781 RepID=A0ABW4L4Q3_9MICO